MCCTVGRCLDVAPGPDRDTEGVPPLAAMIYNTHVTVDRRAAN